jgi:SAM-dependent methyltransferase
MILSERVGKQGYMVSFAYMIRDWAGLEGGESEIKAITQQLVRSINQKFEEIDRSVPMLFLGAGMGRIASEVSAQIGTKVFAVDNSLTMAHLFGKISRQDVRFFEINLKNAMGASDIVVEHSASMTVLKNRPSNVQFLIGDATQLPFDNQSISCVVSVFFTDVVPLPMLIKELKRVLKPGGLFIHFGPLEYHHEDVRFMYSLEEILSIFENQGFATTSPKNFTLPHCRTSSTGLFKTYRCWLFEAEKNMPIQKIASSTVISIAKEIDFVQNGSIGPNFYNTQSSIALGVNDVYEGAETIIDILKILLTPKTFDELIQIMSLDYGGIDLPQVEQIKRVLLDLAYKGMLNLGDQTNQR